MSESEIFHEHVNMSGSALIHHSFPSPNALFWFNALMHSVDSKLMLFVLFGNTPAFCLLISVNRSGGAMYHEVVTMRLS